MIGMALVATGVAEIPISWFVASRISDPAKRPLILVAMAISSLLMMGLGVAFITGRFP